MFPSLERSAKNQSELSLLKLPEIASGAGILKRVHNRQSNESHNNRESLGPSQQQLQYQRELMGINGVGVQQRSGNNEERKEKLRQKLDKLYHINNSNKP